MMISLQDTKRLTQELGMSNDDRSLQILSAIQSLSEEVHGLSGQFGRLDERLLALDQKVDNRVQGVEAKVLYLEQRVQTMYDKVQDLEIRLNRVNDYLAPVKEDIVELKDKQEKTRDRWLNRVVTPILVAAVISAGAKFI